MKLPNNYLYHFRGWDRTQMGFSVSNCCYTNGRKQISWFIVWTENRVERTSKVGFLRKNSFALVIRKRKSKCLGEQCFFFMVKLLEGHVESRHYSGLVTEFWWNVVVEVVKLEEDHLTDLFAIVCSQVVEVIEFVCIVFEFWDFSFGRQEMEVVASFIFLGANSDIIYINLTWAAVSGE